MTATPIWREVESQVHQPGSWIVLTVGAFFFLVGTIGFVGSTFICPPDDLGWCVSLGAGIFALIGAAVLTGALTRILRPIYVRHAAPDVLPQVSTEPVICEGAVVHGRLTHELYEDPQGWHFRPATHLWRNNKRFLLGFGIPFLAFFSGLLAWVFHSQLNVAGWFVSAICGIAVTMVCGGSAFILIGMMMRACYRRLSRLSIPRDGSNLELDAPESPDMEKADLLECLKWGFIGTTQRRQLSIPRELVQAVQLCPWKFIAKGRGEKQITWAVQGLLVLASSEAEYYRVPILLTSDFVKAARLMQRLAETLRVPYLFSADAAGWQIERTRAKSRPPLQAGGMIS